MKDSDSDTYMAIIEEGGMIEARRFILRLGAMRFGAPDEPSPRQ